MLLKTFSSNTSQECIMSCSMNKECDYVVIEPTECNLYKGEMKIYSTTRGGKTWYPFERTGNLNNINMLRVCP